MGPISPIWSLQIPSGHILNVFFGAPKETPPKSRKSTHPLQPAEKPREDVEQKLQEMRAQRSPAPGLPLCSNGMVVPWPSMHWILDHRPDANHGAGIFAYMTGPFLYGVNYVVKYPSTMVHIWARIHDSSWFLSLKHVKPATNSRRKHLRVMRGSG